MISYVEVLKLANDKAMEHIVKCFENKTNIVSFDGLYSGYMLMQIKPELTEKGFRICYNKYLKGAK